jgi:hypothetical protein
MWYPADRMRQDRTAKGPEPIFLRKLLDYLMYRLRYALLLLLITSTRSFAQSATFPIVRADSKATILYDRKGPALDSVSAHLLSEDIERVTGYRPEVITELSKARGNVIVIGAHSSELIQSISPKRTALLRSLQGRTESSPYP